MIFSHSHQAHEDPGGGGGGGGGTPYIGLYGEARPERGIGMSRVQVYERVGKSVLQVFKRAFHYNISNTYLITMLF